MVKFHDMLENSIHVSSGGSSGLHSLDGQTVQTRQTQTWIAKLVAKCFRMDPHIVSLAQGNLVISEVRRGYVALTHQKALTWQS